MLAGISVCYADMAHIIYLLMFVIQHGSIADSFSGDILHTVLVSGDDGRSGGFDPFPRLFRAD
jgi:hypothetical protein